MNIWAKKYLCGLAFAAGLIMVVDHNQALAGSSIMVSISIVVGAWMIAAAIDRNAKK
ncbi:MAG: hypothetical protein LBD30_00950 [Verrucomicrobiales bacterium]|jgi:formate/nitrite transporter FocA (FNT family)|nr:hypothetical protein [Verrucomicrobiales bacterium]